MNEIKEAPPGEDGAMPNRLWAFGSVTLNERTFELTVTGRIIHVERKALQVLIYLLNHANEVVTKDELAENVWPGRILSENVIPRCVSVLREALKGDRSCIRTVHGYGYRLVADVRIERARRAATSRFNFQPGAIPPLRPQWRLVERLGAGGHGEAWLSRHEKTRETRVFKFALDERALVSLKREITLYRFLQESLGDSAGVVRLLEWNLEEAPCFIETEFLHGRDLLSWTDSLGGVSSLAMERRIELVAKVADTLAAAHSVGVLHKDLKPSNVLVDSKDEVEEIKLGDFGSGGVLDPQRLDALGITRLGFTETSTVDRQTATTVFYTAPEVLRGVPFTVKADIYALGVLLYQMVIGDLRRPLAAGWDLEVADELLREDISMAAAGDPGRRLGDAAELARRLRTLEQRRQARVEILATRERAERHKRATAELRRVRRAAITFLLLAATSVMAGIIAFRERDDARQAATTAEAITNFLTEDVLAVDPAVESPAATSYESLLNRAASTVDSRFQSQMKAAATIHWLLGRRYHEIGQIQRATREYRQAADLFVELFGREATPTLLAFDRLAPIYLDQGYTREALLLADELEERWIKAHGTHDLSSLMVRIRVARIRFFAGQHSQAEKSLRAVLRDASSASATTAETRDFLRQSLGISLAADISALKTDAALTEAVRAHAGAVLGGGLAEFNDDFAMAEPIIRESLASYVKLFGSDSEPVASTKEGLGWVLGMEGRYKEGERLIDEAERFYQAWLPPTHGIHSVSRLLMARIWLEQQHSLKATALLEEALSLCRNENCLPRVQEEIRFDLARSYLASGRLNEAVSLLRASLEKYEGLLGPSHIGSLRRRVALAESLYMSGRSAEAQALVSAIPTVALQGLPPHHRVALDFKRLNGLLLMRLGDKTAGKRALSEAYHSAHSLLGPQNWRTLRLQRDLSSAKAIETVNPST